MKNWLLQNLKVIVLAVELVETIGKIAFTCSNIGLGLVEIGWRKDKDWPWLFFTRHPLP